MLPNRDAVPVFLAFNSVVYELTFRGRICARTIYQYSQPIFQSRLRTVPFQSTNSSVPGPNTECPLVRVDRTVSGDVMAVKPSGTSYNNNDVAGGRPASGAHERWIRRATARNCDCHSVASFIVDAQYQHRADRATILHHQRNTYESTTTQPCIPPGSLNRVPASAGIKAGMSPLPGGR